MKVFACVGEYAFMAQCFDQIFNFLILTEGAQKVVVIEISSQFNFSAEIIFGPFSSF